jgi:hypothetical protein
MKMNRQVLFDRLWDLVKESDVDFLEVYVGDEEEGQVYVRFENLEEGEGARRDAGFKVYEE